MDIHQQKAPTQRPQGFSAIELLIVLGILAILAALAAPSFLTAIDKYRVNSAKDELVAAIQFARMESVRRGVQVSLTRTTGCGVTLENNNDWSCGYKVYVDSNANEALDAGELVLQTFEVPRNYYLKHPNKGDSLDMNIWGLPQSLSHSFLITPRAGDNAFTTNICISSGGRVRTAVGTGSCS